jgi:glycerol-3-phosphate dehydrogenase
MLEQGAKNGCVGLRRLDRNEMTAMEPLVGGLAAMYSGNTAVIDPFLYTIHLAEAAMLNGVKCFMNAEVTAIERQKGKYRVAAGGKTYFSDIIVNAAGLYSDLVAALAGDQRYRIYPSRGEYFVLDKQAGELVGMPVYPVPRKGVGGLGIHLTTTVNGNVLIGPSAEYVETVEAYESSQKIMDQLFSEATQLLPQIKRNMIIGAYTGIRAKIVPKGGADFGDFIIEESKAAPNMINLVGIESPGLTASIPISRLVAEMLNVKQRFQKKADYKPEYKGSPIFRDLRIAEQNQLISENPGYGEIVCRCETITRAEIISALNNPLGARTVIAVKNRTRATMGRCNGGFCLTRIVDTLLRQGAGPSDIAYRRPGDQPFVGVVK